MDYVLVVTSLAHIISDRKYRTVSGFFDLIEYEWILGGHPFPLRCRSVFTPRFDQDIEGQERSGPLFLLFLNCVYQLIESNKTSFEFTPQLLNMIYNRHFSTQFGVFFYSCSKDRLKNDIESNCDSLWEYIESPKIKIKLMNPIYDPDSLFKSYFYAHEQAIWSEMFFKSQFDFHSRSYDCYWEILRELARK
ncbi:Myotubularin-related protein 9 [Thelohanellus kitauei]|uniref:Myotubularin-related protein 9 n=1 Tax=Thelohanellus kitauei TaxID=669202 RepID=A0A0C2MPL6_THEKT|nr:Myotubularin-related protein 9 [Thelohanellus kitauei]